MAKALVAGPLALPFRNHRKRYSHRCSCSPRSNNGQDGSPAIKVLVEGVTELLRLFSSKKPRFIQETTKQIANEEGCCRVGHALSETNRGRRPSVPSVSSIDDVLEVIQDDYERAYFLTGNFTPDIYTEDCLFEDPTIKFRGRDKYGQNLDLLVPFFDNPSLELEQIQKGFSPETSFILASWKLRTYLKLPWRPLISIKGQTTYNLDRDYKITKHSERWSISATEAIGQIFGFSSREVDV